MAELKIGTQVKLLNGGSCRIKKELGRGGQGIVYLVDYNGKDYALKWYIVKYDDVFYDNLKQNISKGAPSSSFLWPEALTEYIDGSFGYLMKVRPSGYEEIGAFMLAKARFASVDALLNACLQICTGFQQLHLKGLSYQDMNDGNFFINPQSGDVLICDNDNVSPNGTNLGILGKPGYMAPEIVERESMPNRYTDYFSLSVILFILIYLNRPFEGKWVQSCPCLLEEYEKKLFGKSCVFIMDPQDMSNRPVSGVHTNVIRRWPLFPKELQDAFIQTFSKEAIMNPSKRIMDKTWQNLLIQVRSKYAQCPICGKKTFIELDGESKCLECGKVFNKPRVLKVGKYSIPLVPGQHIYYAQISIEDSKYLDVAGVVVRNPNDPNLWGIKNLSCLQWMVTTTQNEIVALDSGKVMPVISGLKIKFSKEISGEII